MPTPDNYRRIAERYLQAAQLVSAQVWEVSGFASYHAFESIGAAWIRHRGRRVPRTHPRKLTAFLSNAPPAHKRGIAVLIQLLNGLRNQVLYPVPNGVGGYDNPENVFPAANAHQLCQRVLGVYNIIAPLL
jgi:hypothetical protein